MTELVKISDYISIELLHCFPSPNQDESLELSDNTETSVMIPAANQPPQSCQRTRLVFIILVCSGLYYLIGSEVLSRDLDKSRLPVPKIAADQDETDYKYILTWSEAYDDPLYGWPRSYQHLGGFQRAGCGESRCHLTSNRSYLGNYHSCQPLH